MQEKNIMMHGVMIITLILFIMELILVLQKVRMSMRREVDGYIIIIKLIQEEEDMQ